MKDEIPYIVSTAGLSSDQVELFRHAGLEIHPLRFIETRVSVSDITRERLKGLQHSKETVVFTSAHAVKAVITGLTRTPEWQVACIGGATRQELERHYPSIPVIATAANAKELAEILIKEVKGQVIFFCGNRRLDILPDLLRNNGIGVEEIQVYETDLTPGKIHRDPAAVLFFSTSAVESFFQLNALPAETVCFAIGETTAGALKQKTKNKIITASHPGKKEVIELVIKYYHEHS